MLEAISNRLGALFYLPHSQAKGAFMHKEVLLFILRQRLALVNRLLEDVAHVEPSSYRYMYACGQTQELRSEGEFLVDLIVKIEGPADGQQ